MNESDPRSDVHYLGSSENKEKREKNIHVKQGISASWYNLSRPRFRIAELKYTVLQLYCNLYSSQ